MKSQPSDRGWSRRSLAVALALAWAFLVAGRLAAAWAEVQAPGVIAFDGLALFAALWAALALERGDGPRPGWLLRGAAMAGLMVGRGMHFAMPNSHLHLAPILLANVLGAIALVYFAQLAFRSPLRAEFGVGRQFVLLAAVVGCVAAMVFITWRDPSAPMIVSAACDAVVFVCALLTVLSLSSMSAGVATWAYLLLSIDGLAYLLVDVGNLLGGEASWLSIATACGWAATVLAGVVQVIVSSDRRIR